MSENKYFLYGSGRDAATRATRRTRFPREINSRIGPYVVRAGKSYGPLTAAQLAGYERPVIEKVTNGTVQVYLNERPLGLGDLKALFAAVRGMPEVVNYEGMSLAALHAFTRDHQQDDQAWYWLLVRLLEDGQRGSAGSALEYMATMGIKLEDERLAHIESLMAACRAEDIAPTSAEDEAVAEPEPEPEIEAPAEPEPAEELEAAPEPAPASEEAPTNVRVLPDGWKDMSNKKLAELIKNVGAEMPARTDKGALIAALEAWVKG